jgi:hypothetical protein
MRRRKRAGYTCVSLDGTLLGPQQSASTLSTIRLSKAWPEP